MKALLLLCCLCLCFQWAWAQNPFMAAAPTDSTQTEIQQNTAESPTFSFMQQIRSSWMKKIILLQKEYKQKLSQLAMKLRRGFAWNHFLLLLFFSGLYGFFHALGPGHGKIFVISYFSGFRTSWLSAVLFSFTLAFLHSSSAVVLVIVTRFILNTLILDASNQADYYLRLISYSFIIGIGLILFIRQRRNPIPQEKTASWTHWLPFAISVGFIPCTGSVIILLFAISLRVFVLGLIMVYATAVGMALCLSLIAGLAISARTALIHKNFICNDSFRNRLGWLPPAALIGIGLIALILAL